MLAGLGPNGESYEPVIYPTQDFNPESDAEFLEKCMKGFGTDEKGLIKILCHRTSEERAQIAKTYKSLYGKDLVKQIKSETSGDFGKLLRYLCLDPHMLRAKICFDSIQGAGTDEHGLIEIICSATNADIEMMKEAYKKVLEFKGKDVSKRSLEKDVENDCSGFFRRILIALLQGEREEPTYEQYTKAQTEGVNCLINEAEAKKFAHSLFNAGEGKLGTDESTFIRIIARESVWQISAIDMNYQALGKKSLREAVRSETSGDFGRALGSTHRCGTFAIHLNKAMKGLGTREATLIRICATRADVDMQEIKNSYQRQFGKSLAEDIKGETSGDFRNALLALIGEGL